MIVEQTRRALGAILNLSRYKPATTLEEANARLCLIDQIALKALGDFKETAFSETGVSRLVAPPRETANDHGKIAVRNGRFHVGRRMA